MVLKFLHFFKIISSIIMKTKTKKNKKKSALKSLYIIRNELQILYTEKLSCCDPQPCVKLLKVNFKHLQPI